METLERVIADHPFFSGLESYYTGLLVGCAANVRFHPGTYIFRKARKPTSSIYCDRAGWRWNCSLPSTNRS